MILDECQRRWTGRLALLCLLLSGFRGFASPPPVISTQPVSQTVAVGTTATFSVTATSGTTLTYQWYYDSKAVASATNSALTLASVPMTDAGTYYVVVRNAGGSVDSSPVTLTVTDTPPVANNQNYTVLENTPLTVAAPGVLTSDTDSDGDPLTAVLKISVSHGVLALESNGSFTYTPTSNFFGTDGFTYEANDGYDNSAAATVTITVLAPPAITNQPTNLTVYGGQGAAFAVGAGGTGPLNYQWTLNGTNIAGATNATYSLAAAQITNSGNYSVVITNVAGAVTSSVAALTVLNTNFQFTQAWLTNYTAAQGAATATAMTVDGAGNVYLTGYAQGAAGPDQDYITIKYGPSNNFLWLVSYDSGAGNSQPVGIAADANGNVYVTGTSAGQGTGNDYATVKYNSNGVQQWVARYNGAGNQNDQAAGLALDSNGDVFVTGRSVIGTGPSGHNAYATIKYDPNGNQIWLATYTNTPSVEDDATSIAVDPSGNVYVTGQSQGGGTAFDYATIKYSNGGAQLWLARYNGAASGNDIPTQIAADSSGNCYVTGSSYYKNNFNGYATVKYDPNGNQLWAATYDPTKGTANGATALAVDASGNVIVTGSIQGASGAGNDYATVKYNSSGQQLWAQTYNGGQDDDALALALDPSGDIYVTGKSQSTADGYDIVTIKYRTVDGNQMGLEDFNSAAADNDVPIAIAVDSNYNVYVAGQGYTPPGEYALLEYQSSFLPPLVTVAPATNITTNSALLSASINSHGALTSWTLSYGTNTNYTSTLIGASLPPGTSTVSETLSNLAPDTQYHYSFIASNSAGLCASADATFITLPLPPSGATAAASSITSATAVLNGTITSQLYSIAYYFQYGRTAAYGYFTPTNVLNAGTNGSTLGSVPVSVAVANLAFNTTCHYRLVMVGAGGVTLGADTTFATLPYARPIAATNSYILAENSVLTVAAPGILANDSDTDGATLTAVLASSPADGALSLNANGGFTYTPAANFSGTDSFTYEANDGYENSSATTVTLIVAPPPAITSQPSNLVVYDGQTAAFTVAVTSVALSYQWMFNGTNINGATNIAFSLAAAQLTNAGSYSVTISNLAGMVTSSAAALTVLNTNFQFNRAWLTNYAAAQGPATSTAMTVDAAGDVYLTGYAQGVSGPDQDYITIKYGPGNNFLWQASYDSGAGNSQPVGIAVDTNGNVYVTGTSAGQGTGNDYATVKYSSNGIEQWVARYNGVGNQNDQAAGLALDSNGDVFVTGRSVIGTGPAGHNAYATIKYDSNGNELWLATYTNTPSQEDDATSIAVDPAGNVYVTGQSQGGPATQFDYATIKYSNNGAQLWLARYNGPGNQNDTPVQIVADASGNCYVTGSSANANNNTGYATVKYDPNGNQLWVARDDNVKGDNNTASALAVDSSGNVIVTGSVPGASAPGNDYATVKYNSSGQQLWTETYNGGQDDDALALALDPSGDVYVTGKSQSAADGYDIVTIKYRTLDGAQMALDDFNSSGNINDIPAAIAVDGNYNVYVAGQGYNPAEYVLLEYQSSFLPPLVTAASATNITTNSALLSVGVNSHGALTSWTLSYGTNTNYASTVAGGSLPPGTTTVFEALSNLAPDTQYHYSFAASNSAGLAATADATFVTLPLPPSGSTIGASNITSATAVLNGSITNQWFSIAYYFQYGKTIAYGHLTKTNVLSAITNILNLGPVTVSVPVSSLLSNTTYHVRLVTVGLGGSTLGADTTFATLPYELPTGVANSYTLGENSALTVAAPGILSNDSDTDGAALNAVLVSSTASGALSLNANGGFTYTPSANFSGTDSFIYEANDGYSNSAQTTVTLNVLPPPSITTQPANQAVYNGQGATLAVAAAGPALSYQWMFDGTNITGATNSSFSLAAAQITNAGAYSVMVSNLAGVVTSATATLTVLNTNFQFTQAWLTNYVAAQGPATPTAMTVDAIGNVYLTGYAQGVSGPDQDYITIKYGPSSNFLWQASYDSGAGNSQPVGIAVDANGNVYVTGTSAGQGTGNDYATVKYNSNGIQQWVARYNGAGNQNDQAAGLALDANGNVFVTGRSVIGTDAAPGPGPGPAPGPAGNNAYATIKYDSNGNELWLATYTNTPSVEDDATSIAVDPAGNVYVTGQSQGGPATQFDYATIKYSNNGAQLWLARYNGPGNQNDTPVQIVADASGNCYVTGSSANANNNTGYATVKYDPNGNPLWVARDDNVKGDNNTASALAVDSSGNVIVTGSVTGASGPGNDYATVKYNSSGQQLWVETYNGGQDDDALALALDSSGDIYVTGKSQSAADGYDIVTIKYRTYDGTQMGLADFNSAAADNDVPAAIVVDGNYNVYVAGQGYAPPGEYVLLEYRSSFLQPVIATKPASPITTNSALLGATIDSEGALTAWALFYGPTAAYGSNSTPGWLPPGVTPVSVALTNLTPDTLYHYMFAASNAAGVALGSDATFITLPGPPTGSTLAASNITAGSALLNGVALPQWSSVQSSFQYGPTTNYGSISSPAVIPAMTSPSNAVPIALALPLSNLVSGQVYHYCLVLNGAGGTTYGSDMTFSTLGLAPIQPACTFTPVPGASIPSAQLCLTNTPGASFTVLGSANLQLPLSNWTILGSMLEVSPGVFQFTNSPPPSNPIYYYRVRSP